MCVCGETSTSCFLEVGINRLLTKRFWFHGRSQLATIVLQHHGRYVSTIDLRRFSSTIYDGSLSKLQPSGGRRRYSAAFDLSRKRDNISFIDRSFVSGIRPVGGRQMMPWLQSTVSNKMYWWPLVARSTATTICNNDSFLNF